MVPKLNLETPKYEAGVIIAGPQRSVFTNLIHYHASLSIAEYYSKLFWSFRSFKGDLQHFTAYVVKQNNTENEAKIYDTTKIIKLNKQNLDRLPGIIKKNHGDEKTSRIGESKEMSGKCIALTLIIVMKKITN
jgi:hypothetical protein